VPNPYLASLREKYTSLKTSIEGLQNAALERGEDLSEEELTSVRGMSDQAETLHTQIAQLTEIEIRDRKVQELAAQVMSDATAAAVKSRTDAELTSVGSVQERGKAQRLGQFTTRDRDPGHYTRSSSNSFFGDLHRARNGDDDAARRLAEHNRAL
jgi:hypothetical protein